MAAQQPDYAAIGNHLQDLANEIVLIPNTAPVTLQQLEFQQQIQQFENRVVARLDLIPIQIYNSELPNSSPL